MIDRGANPFVVQYNGETWAAETRNLSNLPNQKSVYFLNRPLPDEFNQQNDFLDPWFYKTGIFNGKYNSVIGRGAA